MSLVENLISQIASPSSAGVTKPTGFNLDDDTFAKLLEKASQVTEINNENNLFGELGAPAGFQIEQFGVEEATPAQTINPTSEIEIKDLIISENQYFSLINDSSNVMNLAIKHAANAYTTFNKGLVENLGDFAEDITNMAK